MLTKILHGDSSDFYSVARCQGQVVNERNPESAKATAISIPSVLLRDEIKTDGYGIAIIEILCISGILHKIVSTKNVTIYRWEKKRLYLCMDVILLDRDRSFKKIR